MKKNIIYLGLALLLTLTNISLADTVKTKPTMKIGSNVLSLILLGDINGYFEKEINSHFSWVATGHYIATGKLNDLKTNARTSLGIRTYTNLLSLDMLSKNKLKKNHSLIGNFLEFKTGFIRIESFYKPTLEFSAGKTNMFNEKVYYEVKLGLMRVLDDNEVIPYGSFGMGLLL